VVLRDVADNRELVLKAVTLDRLQADLPDLRPAVDLLD